MKNDATIKMAVTAADFAVAQTLIAAYVQWLGMDLAFQQFDKEMDSLPQMYNAQHGGLFIAYRLQQAVGVAGLRQFSAAEGEVKRMFVQTDCRGMRIGQLLLSACIDAAKKLGYHSVKLDTIDTMKPAIQLYTANGFVEIKAYRHNPHEAAKYFELQLK